MQTIVISIVIAAIAATFGLMLMAGIKTVDQPDSSGGTTQRVESQR